MLKSHCTSVGCPFYMREKDVYEYPFPTKRPATCGKARKPLTQVRECPDPTYREKMRNHFGR